MEIPYQRIKTLTNKPRAILYKHLERNRLPAFLRVRLAVLAHEITHGKKMDIHHPTAFQEKILWYTLSYQHPDLSRIVDKYRFKQYIAEKLGSGHTVPMLGAWDSVEAFKRDWDKLPEEFCLKSTLQCAGEGIRMIHHKSDEDLKEICEFVRHYLDPKHTLINSYFSAYYDATPMMIAEKLVKPAAAHPLDYKIFCFSGVPYIISFHNSSWEKMDTFFDRHPNGLLPRPVHFEEMRKLAETLSKEFPYVRVDFFDTPEKLYVAELTFNTGVGNMTKQSKAFYLGLGDLFILPE